MERKKLILLVICLVLVGAIFLAYQFRGTIYKTLNNWDLIPQPETFTELYFNNPSTLPRAIVAGQPISFSFTVHNVEGTTTVYTYIVYFEDSSGARTIFAGDNVTLASDASTTIAVSHVFPASDEQGEVVVDLPALNQQIDFLLPDNN